MPARRNAIARMAGLAAFALTVGAIGCRPAPSVAPEGEARAAAPAKGHILLLPDSAIVVDPGSIEEQLAQFLASKEPAPRTFRFVGREFEPWASEPTPETLQTMYALVQILRAYPHVTVTITGYTDNVGPDERNRALATARAKKLAGLLEQGGVRPVRISTVGAGPIDFIGDNATEAGRQLNRRIELTVTRK
ncbi:OmpA family protein [Sphingomonas nostoxanthinifaciens]|uniref:OmpA family protein n=1 Tax=Sphingomonas nostoxanthinifaciens TaxID=2872652 RepID=UPI001CC219C5|nr:OmpA family protein [Sphingomonas nostoxanthinifaciens]UAK23575.1 OmpA family protein [Sphingomonas nostoxanthinifaciens]